MAFWNHGVSSMKQWKLAVVAAASVSLTGCFEGEYGFEGKYFPTEGEECTTPANANDREQYLLEITKEVHNGNALYAAKFPVAARAGAPITSAQNVSPTDENVLNFRFTKAEVSGVFSGSPAVDIVVSVTPNQSKDGHIWLTKATTTMVRNGDVKETDILGNLRRTQNIGAIGLCLKKATAQR
jgi:hypothetical protein